MIHRYYLPRCDRTSPMPWAPGGSSELPFIYKKKSTNYILMFTVRKSNWNDNQIGHLGVSKFLTFKTRLRVKPFLVKLKFYLHENRKEITVISIASQLARFETEAWGSLEIMLKKVRKKFLTRFFTKPSGSDKLQITCNVKTSAFSWSTAKKFRYMKDSSERNIVLKAHCPFTI